MRQGVRVVLCCLAVALGSGSCADNSDVDEKRDARVSDLAQADAPRDAPTSDGPVDAPPFQDAPYPIDATSPEGILVDSGLQSCTTHCDCTQGWFCYYGTCIKDPTVPVYCCAKGGCPPPGERRRGPGQRCGDLPTDVQATTTRTEQADEDDIDDPFDTDRGRVQR